MAGGGSKVQQNGLDPALSSQMLVSMAAEHKAQLESMRAMHSDTMQSMNDIVKQMRMQHSEANENLMNLSTRSRAEASESMAAMGRVTNSLMDMMGPIMMSGMQNGTRQSVLGYN